MILKNKSERIWKEAFSAYLISCPSVFGGSEVNNLSDWSVCLNKTTRLLTELGYRPEGDVGTLSYHTIYLVVVTRQTCSSELSLDV
jgi:hypothetical protein